MFVRGAHWRHLVKTIEPVIVTVGLYRQYWLTDCVYTAPWFLIYAAQLLEGSYLLT